MSDFVLDHLFVMTAPGAPEADDLLLRDFIEGPPNRHPGQGTACRRFYFANAMLEFLWVENEAEARSDLVRPLRLWERWEGRETGACPFGIALRPTAPGLQPPFPTFEYWPSFFPAPAHVDVRASMIQLPLKFVLPYFDPRPVASAPILKHYRIEGTPPNSFMEIDFEDVPPLRFAMIASRPRHV
jgi:hypothetical protein